MKRLGNVMPEIAAIDNLMLAFCKARRGKLHRQEVIDYSLNLVENLLNLRDKLLNGTLQVGNYHYFEIYDPKKRKICAASFEERIVHHAIINVCKDRFERNLIYETYATREGKGVYAAINRARVAVHKYPYVAKLDVRKYFDSINHNVLKAKLLRIFKDKKLLCLLNSIIDSYQTAPSTGIPIGNLTSQYFANFYLSSLDHLVKEKFKVPIYVRYMDDILLAADSREELKKIVLDIKNLLKTELFLELKSAQICNVNCGVSFLGYTLFPNFILLNRRSKLRLIKKWRYYSSLLMGGTWNDEKYLQHIQPLLAFVNKANTTKLRKELCKLR